jgi:hypothetical protein
VRCLAEDRIRQEYRVRDKAEGRVIEQYHRFVPIGAAQEPEIVGDPGVDPGNCIVRVALEALWVTPRGDRHQARATRQKKRGACKQYLIHKSPFAVMVRSITSRVEQDFLIVPHIAAECSVAYGRDLPTRWMEKGTLKGGQIYFSVDGIYQ